MELLIGFLRNPKFKLRPVLKLLQDYLLDIREQVEWGPLVPYGVTGLLNQPPRAAMKIRDSEDRDKFAEFLDACSQ